MPQNLLAIHGVSGLVCAVGEGGRILHWSGDQYEPVEVQSPTKNDLTGVWVESEKSAFAVGSRGTVLRWDGERWGRVALAPKHDELHAVWGCAPEGIWIGGQNRLIQYHGQSGQGDGTIQETDSEVVRIWGSGPDDIFYLCTGRKVLHWNGLGCSSMDLPGEDDDEFYGLGGLDQGGVVWACGVGGMLCYCDGEAWTEHDSGTEDTLSGLCCTGPDDLWVTTNGGQLRHWDGHEWEVAAFSPSGYLSAVYATGEGEIWAVGAGGAVIRHRLNLQ